jgi:hypothetical protein
MHRGLGIDTCRTTAEDFRYLLGGFPLFAGAKHECPLCP